MVDVEAYQRDALRRRIRATRVGRALVVATGPGVLAAALGFDALFGTSVDGRFVFTTAATLLLWSLLLAHTQPRLLRALREVLGVATLLVLLAAWQHLTLEARLATERLAVGVSEEPNVFAATE